MGKKLKEMKLSSNTSEDLDLSIFTSGTYFIKVIDNNESYFQKIILK
jgi:hypothetical protein